MVLSFFKSPFRAQENDDGSFSPSPFTLLVGTSDNTKYKKQKLAATYQGTKPILVVCTDERDMKMENGTNFSTGNHPVETYVPMLHMKDAGFKFDVATEHGSSVCFEMWAFPKKDENVNILHEEMKEIMSKPKKLSEITSLNDYSAIFIPGGHGAMINLPFSKELGRLLHLAHDQSLPTVTLCHGPGALLSTAADGLGKDFAYKGYKIMCFTDKTDQFTPKVGYLPGAMPWKCQETLEKKGIQVLNSSESGKVYQDRELITGDSPDAANNLGILAAPILVEYANKNKM